MLSMMWLTGAALVSIWCCHQQMAAEKKVDDDAPVNWQLGGMGLLAVALSITAETTVIPVFEWLASALPEQGTTLNLMTAAFLTGVACLGYAAGIPLAYYMVLITRDEKNKARQSIGDQ